MFNLFDGLFDRITPTKYEELFPDSKYEFDFKEVVISYHGIIKAVDKAFRAKKERAWNRLYWSIDLHDTIMTATYKKNNTGSKIFPDAIPVLRTLSKMEDQVLILWTSSYKEPADKVLSDLRKLNINFDYFNENPLEPNNALCDFSKKFYFNILLDDKAGFDPEIDWFRLNIYLDNLNK